MAALLARSHLDGRFQHILMCQLLSWSVTFRTPSAQVPKQGGKEGQFGVYLTDLDLCVLGVSIDRRPT